MPASANDKHVVCVETVRKQPWAVRSDFDHILDMPMSHVRFQGQDHARFQFLMAIRDYIRFLLMPPGAYAMANQGDPIVKAMLTELLRGKRMNSTGFGAYFARLNGLADRDFKAHFSWRQPVTRTRDTRKHHPV
jgi:hypothetical protein